MYVHMHRVVSKEYRLVPRIDLRLDLWHADQSPDASSVLVDAVEDRESRRKAEHGRRD